MSRPHRLSIPPQVPYFVPVDEDSDSEDSEQEEQEEEQKFETAMDVEIASQSSTGLEGEEEEDQKLETAMDVETEDGQRVSSNVGLVFVVFLEIVFYASDCFWFIQVSLFIFSAANSLP